MFVGPSQGLNNGMLGLGTVGQLPNSYITPFPTEQEGFVNSYVGQQTFLKTGYWEQVLPASNMLRTPVEDRQFARTNALPRPEPGFNLLPAGIYRPLYADPYIVAQNKKHQFEREFMSSASITEEALLNTNWKTRASKPVAFVIDCKQPKFYGTLEDSWSRTLVK